jgi:predicted nucleic acid-binding Zn ribbon protein
MPKKDTQLEKLGDVLDQSLKRLNLSGRLDDYGVWPIWNETVGPTIARNAQPEKIRNGTLFVKVTSPVWMQQLQFMKEMISDKLNRRLSGEVVKNIFFVVGRIEAPGLESVADSKPARHPPPAQAKLDEEILQSVEDPEVRQALRKLFASYARRKATNRE